MATMDGSPPEPAIKGLVSSKPEMGPLGAKKSHQSTLWASFTTCLVVISSLGVFLLALRNTLTLHLQNVWGASGGFWQQQWERSVDAAGGNMMVVLIAGMVGVSYFVYWICALMFLFMDVTQMPTMLRKYKVQPGTNEPVEFWKLMKVVAVVHFNQLVMMPAGAVTLYYMFQLRGCDTSPTLPTFHWVLFEIVIFVLGEEVGFYYSHRLLHHRSLYKQFHKLHHEWQSPVAAIVLYCHPVEALLSNMLPGMIGPMITGCHMSTFILWVQIQIVFSMHQHSGYHLPFMPSPEAHDYHHLKFTECFGVLGILDMLHGTDEKFRASRHYSRDFIAFTTTPVREAFPDTDYNQRKITDAENE